MKLDPRLLIHSDLLTPVWQVFFPCRHLAPHQATSARSCRSCDRPSPPASPPPPTRPTGGPLLWVPRMPRGFGYHSDFSKNYFCHHGIIDECFFIPSVYLLQVFSSSALLIFKFGEPDPPPPRHLLPGFPMACPPGVCPPPHAPVAGQPALFHPVGGGGGPRPLPCPARGFVSPEPSLWSSSGTPRNPYRTTPNNGLWVFFFIRPENRSSGCGD